jgi:DNA repair photolyase
MLAMRVTEIRARSILTRTRIPGVDYCINAYTGCAHGCRYCYATFMKKFTGHDEPWGSFVDVKVNAVELLRKAMRRRHTGEVVLSSVTDPYQPLESRYRLTRGCLELLAQSSLRVSILTKSDLVVRDTDVLRRMDAVEVGFSISTDNEAVRRMFEPASPCIRARIDALGRLHEQGITTYVFIGPILPMDPGVLVEAVAPVADCVLIDRMNYAWKVRELYRAHHLEHALEPAYFTEVQTELLERLETHGIDARAV